MQKLASNKQRSTCPAVSARAHSEITEWLKDTDESQVYEELELKRKKKEKGRGRLRGDPVCRKNTTNDLKDKFPFESRKQF